MKAAADNILFPALEQTFMAVVLVDERNRVLFFNEAAEKLWGYSRDEVLGRDMNILIPGPLGIMSTITATGEIPGLSG